MHQYPALNQLNATLKRICRSNATQSSDRLKESSMDHQNRMPFESFSIDAGTYNQLVANNRPLPIDVSELRDAVVRPSMSNLTSTTFADIQSVHASTCNLVTALRASSQSIVGESGGGNPKFSRHCNSNSAMNLRYDSLRSHKARNKRSNSEQLNSSYYHFQNIDGEMDNNSTTFDSVLLPTHANDNYKLPWKHRQCPSISSSSSSSSSNMSSKCCCLEENDLFVCLFGGDCVRTIITLNLKHLASSKFWIISIIFDKYSRLWHLLRVKNELKGN